MDNSRKLALIRVLIKVVTTILDSLKTLKPKKQENSEKITKLKMIRLILQILLQVLMIGTSVFVTINNDGEDKPGGNQPNERTETHETD